MVSSGRPFVFILGQWLTRILSDVLSLKFYKIDIPEDETKSAKTPATLELRILNKYNLRPGDFIFLEWEKLNEDLLVTSERSALISSHTSMFPEEL